MFASSSASAKETPPPLLAAVQLAKSILPSATHNEYVLLGHLWCGQAFLTHTPHHGLYMEDLLALLTDQCNTSMVLGLHTLSGQMAAAQEWLPLSRTTAIEIEQASKGVTTLAPWGQGATARIDLYSIVMGNYDKVYAAYADGIYNQIVAPIAQRNLFLSQVFDSISNVLTCETPQALQAETQAFVGLIKKYFAAKQIEHKSLTAPDMANILDYFRSVTDTSGIMESRANGIVQRFADTLRTPHNEMLWQINRPAAHHRPFLLESSAHIFAKSGPSHLRTSIVAETLLAKTPLQFI